MARVKFHGKIIHSQGLSKMESKTVWELFQRVAIILLKPKKESGKTAKDFISLRVK